MTGSRNGNRKLKVSGTQLVKTTRVVHYSSEYSSPRGNPISSFSLLTLLYREMQRLMATSPKYTASQKGIL